LSYVSIWKPVNDRIVQVSRESENEVIGLLIGRLENETLIIEDSITGEFQAGPNHVTLPSSTIARIADDILSGRIRGNIIGWYHSHTESGLVFSETDVQTQMKLQQFSSLITAMVIDAKTGDVAYFRVDPQTGKPIRIPDDNVTAFEEMTEAIASGTKTELRLNPAPTAEVAQPSLRHVGWLSSRTIVICVILALVASLAVLMLVFHPSLTATSSTPIPHHQTVQQTVR
jgi:proteasome lid subunit RPN8/RPN11